MSLLVDNPILNSPYEVPARYWDYMKGQPMVTEGRRPLGYYLRLRTRGPQRSVFEEGFVRMRRNSDKVRGILPNIPA